MTNRNKRVFEMLVRIVVFRETYRNLIAAGSQEDKLFDVVEAAHTKLAEHATLQTSGQNAGLLSSGERRAAREELRSHLETLCRTAAGIGLKQFFMPRDKSDRSLSYVGRVFIPQAELLKSEFVANHLPEDFVERLQASVERLEGAIATQAVTKGKHLLATTGIASEQSKALAAIARLDPIIENLLRENETVKSVWESARRVEKASTGKSASPPESSAAEPAA